MLINSVFFAVEPGQDEHTRAYIARGLELFDPATSTPRSADNPLTVPAEPLLEILLAMKGVRAAELSLDRFVVTKVESMPWEQVEPPIVKLLQGLQVVPARMPPEVTPPKRVNLDELFRESETRERRSKLTSDGLARNNRAQWSAAVRRARLVRGGPRASPEQRGRWQAPPSSAS